MILYDSKRVPHEIYSETTLCGLIPVTEVGINPQVNRKCASCGEVLTGQTAYYRNGRFFCISEACVFEGFNEERAASDVHFSPFDPGVLAEAMI